MSVVLKKTRNYDWPVPWSVGDNTGEMTATFYLPKQEEFDECQSKQGEKKPMLKLVLKDVEGLEIEDGKKTLNTFKQLRPIILDDPELSRAFYDAFIEMWVKKTQPETWLTSAHTIMDLMQTVGTETPETTNTDSAAD